MNYIGKNTTLRIDRFTSAGAFLSDDNGIDILLPNRYVTEEMKIDQNIAVFIYNDSEDRPVATTEIPLIELNSFALLEVIDVNNFGAFIDWGLMKDLLVPYKEQMAKMKVGGHYLITLRLDELTNRLYGSADISKYLKSEPADIETGEKINYIVYKTIELGAKVVVNNQYDGIIFNDRQLKNLKVGDKGIGYVEFIRHDGKIDISLHPIGDERFDFFTEQLIEYIKNHDGKISLNDKSNPELIRNELNMSKKSFKKAAGNLFKAQKILITKEGMELLT